jgi:altered-inheritance-of-mitochondria protein 13
MVYGFERRGDGGEQFSQDLVNHLEDTNVSSPETSTHRQGTLDAHIQARIAAELERLQAEEQSVREQIEAALERENLDRETALATDSNSEPESESESAVAKVEEGEVVEKRNLASSVALQAELEEVQRKVERFQKRRQLEGYPDVREARDALLQCYQSVIVYFIYNLHVRRTIQLTTLPFLFVCFVGRTRVGHSIV